MGNLNARKGIEDQCLDNHITQLLPDTDLMQNSNQCSCDDKINSYGRILLILCNNNNLKIAKGQAPGDMVGNYTCFN